MTRTQKSEGRIEQKTPSRTNGKGHGIATAERTIDPSEAAVVAMIRDYKNPTETWLQNLADFADYPLDKAGDLLFENPVGDRLDPAVLGGARALNQLAIATLRKDSIMSSFTKRSIDIDELEDIHTLSIDQINECIGSLATKYQFMGAAVGASSGAFGVFGAALDIPTIMALALRAIGEYATYFGFDVEDPTERQYALLVLTTAATVTDAGRQQALIELTRVGKELAARDNVGPMQQKLSSNLLKRVAQAVAIRMIKGRIGRMLPLLGSIVGGGYGLLFLSEVCKTAYVLYAERWLMRKYGPEIAAEVLAPL